MALIEVEQGKYYQMQTDLADLEAKLKAVEAEAERLREALDFYADPGTYFAVAFMLDSPCGGFTDDFSEVKDAYGFTKRVPGKRARAALAVAPDATEPEEK